MAASLHRAARSGVAHRASIVAVMGLGGCRKSPRWPSAPYSRGRAAAASTPHSSATTTASCASTEQPPLGCQLPTWCPDGRRRVARAGENCRPATSAMHETNATLAEDEVSEMQRQP